jgi:hypothetical protein
MEIVFATGNTIFLAMPFIADRLHFDEASSDNGYVP